MIIGIRCLNVSASGLIWAIMLEFGPFCLDLGPMSWIWSILQNLGLNRPQRRRSPEDGPGGDVRTDVRTDGRTYGRTDSPCVLQDFVPFGAAALLPLILNQTLLKQGSGTADHVTTICKLSVLFNGNFTFCHFWAAALKGMKSCRTQGESVHLSICPSIRPSVRPPPPHPQGFVSFGAYSKPNSAK